MAPVPAGQALYHLHGICTKNSKALFSSKHAHPHSPMAPVTQTITPSPQAPPWLGGGDTGSRTQGAGQAQQVELEAHLWHWKERPRQLEDGLRRGRPHGISEVRLKEEPLSPIPGNLTVSAPRIQVQQYSN